MIRATPRVLVFMRALAARTGALAVALVVGCGGESDAGPPFIDPDELSDGACVDAAVAGMKLDGVWHADVQLAGVPPFAQVMRLVGSADAELTARLGGSTVQDVRVDDDRLFLRAESGAGEDRRIRALHLCARDGDRTLVGAAGWCWGEDCRSGTVRMVRIERIPGEGVAQGVELVGQLAGSPGAPWPGITVNVRVLDGVAYLARYGDGLRIVDVADPAAPVELAHVAPARPAEGEIYNDVKLVDAGTRRYALMASSVRGVVVYDVTDPSAPLEVSTFPRPVQAGERINVHTLAVEGTRAYLANLNVDGLDVWDVTDPAAPRTLGSYVHPDAGRTPSAFVHDLHVEDGLVYLAYWSLGLVMVDATDPSAIRLVGRFADYARRTSHSVWVTTAGGRRVAVHGDEDFGAHVRVIDVDPASAEFMTEVGAWMTRPEVSVHNIMAIGDRAYVAYYQDGLRILDLSDPTAPALAGFYNTWAGGPGMSFFEGATGVDVDPLTGYVYVSDSAGGVFIFNATN